MGTYSMPLRGDIQQFGRLDRKITIQSPTQTKDPVYGRPQLVWSDWAYVWAAKKEGGGREFFQASQVNAEITTMWQIRYMDGVKPDMRIEYQGLIYEIIRIAEVGRQVRLNIWTKARSK